MKSIALFVSVVAFVSSFAGAASADEPRAELSGDVPAQAAPRHDLVRINAGLKTSYIRDTGFDAYSTNDVLPQFSIDGTVPLLTRGNLVLGAGLGWDVGARSDSARGFGTSLTTHRLAVPVEARWHFAPWLYGFGKAAPGAAAMLSSVQEGTTGRTLAATGWAFSAEASLGASILVAPRKGFERREPRIWVTPEVGYALTTSASLRANPGRDAEELLGSDEDTALRSLALSGLFWRASVGLTF